MNTQFYQTQKKFFPLVTYELLKNTRLANPQQVAKQLMTGLSMNEFVVSGSKLISIKSCLYSQFQIAFNLSFAWLGVLVRMYEDMRVHDGMTKYRSSQQRDAIEKRERGYSSSQEQFD